MAINNTYIIDIDDTLLVYPDSHMKPEQREGAERYELAEPNIEEKCICNKLFDQGSTIIIYTGRGWHQYALTKKQLDSFGIKYHELIMGKPHGTWIDRDFLTTLKDVL